MNQNESKVIRVILGDDHPVVRLGVHSELARHPDIKVIGEAVNGDEALSLAESLQPDVLILDVNMPGIRAVDVIRSLRKQPSSPNVLVLSAYGDEEHVRALLSAGAKGYILKDENLAVIVQAIRAVMQGILWLSPGIAHIVSHAMARRTEDRAKSLTAREMEVLRLMARGWNNQRIAQVLSISEAAVKFHIGHIYDKLGVASRVEALLYAAREGWVDLGATGGHEESRSPEHQKQSQVQIKSR